MSQLGYGVNDPRATPFRLEVPLTAFSITMTGQSTLVLNPAGTLATGTVTLQNSPQDGQIFEIISTQTQTALTLTAGTGDTINNAVTALTALTGYRYGYRLADKTWYRLS